MLSFEIFKTIVTSPEALGALGEFFLGDPMVANKNPGADFLVTPEEKRVVLEEAVVNTSKSVVKFTDFLDIPSPQDSIPTNLDTTVAGMLNFFRARFMEKGYLMKVETEFLKKWGMRGDEKVWWTANEKKALGETIKNTVRYYKKNRQLMVLAVLKACEHKIEKELREKDQVRLSFEEVGEKLKKAGIQIREQHKGDPNKPTFIFRGQIHGAETFPGVIGSQDSIYADLIKLITDSISSNFGFEGLPSIEIHSELTPGKMERGVAHGYGSKKGKELMKKYPKTFYYGIEDPETTAKAHIANDNYLLMLKIARHKNFQKVNFGKGMGTQMYMNQLKLHFSRFQAYKNIESIAKDLFQGKRVVSYVDHVEFFKHFLFEWQKWVINERNKKVIEIVLQMANNTRNGERGYVSSDVMGNVHTEEEIVDMTWVLSLDMAQAEMLNLQEVAAAEGCNTYVTD